MRHWPRLTALLLTGCTVGPNYQPPATPTPPNFAEAHVAASLGDAELASWWRRFGDPELERLVNRAVAQNLEVEAAAARIREARARERLAGAAALPQIDAQGSASRQRISENAIPVPPCAGGNAGAASFISGASGWISCEMTWWGYPKCSRTS